MKLNKLPDLLGGSVFFFVNLRGWSKKYLRSHSHPYFRHYIYHKIPSITRSWSIYATARPAATPYRCMFADNCQDATSTREAPFGNDPVCVTPGCRGQTPRGGGDAPSLPDLAPVVGWQLLEE